LKKFRPTEKTRIRRLPDRAHYDTDTVYAILDSAFVCHLGYVIEGQPYVTPTAYWREGDHVYWHGSHASRALDRSANTKVCLTVTQLDALVIARAAFHHSMNYRSAMIFGTPAKVEDEAHKARAMERFVERMYPGQWKRLRPITRNELKATSVLYMKIEEASAKIRTGPPKDDTDDYALPIWAGVVPVEVTRRAPVADPRLAPGVAIPEYLGDLSHLGFKSS
jgi:nitroimidazol reductase NimA-like FMN-containing flavoprotein (pyridoxamine 5'-phosphate oxidase superfamily)